jgi:hypothetical protein
MSTEPANRPFNCGADRSSRWPTARQHAVAAGTFDQRRIAGLRKLRPGIAGDAPYHLAIAAAHDHVGDPGRKLRPLRHRQQVALAFHARDLDQSGLDDHRRAPQQGTRDQNLILARHLVHQRRRCVAYERQPLGQLYSRSGFGVRNEAGEDAVEQIDMRRPELRGACQK